MAAPAALVVVPAGHSVHAPLPARLHLPTGHALHTSPAPPPAVPAAQGLQGAEAEVTKKPAGHCWQAEVRSVTATVPAGQAWQGESAPGAALKNPTAQEVQVCADVAPTVELHVPA